MSNIDALYEILKDNVYIKDGYKIDPIINITPIEGQPELIGIQATSTDESLELGKNTISFKKIQINKNDLIENTSMIYSHAAPGYFIGPKLDEAADVMFHTYRNLLDQTASIHRSFGLSENQLKMIKNDKMPEDLKVTLHTNPINYLILSDDAMDGFYNKLFYLDQLRTTGIDYALVKDTAKCPVIAFDFESLTVTKEKECIQKIADAVSMNIDAENILLKLNELKKDSAAGFRKNKKKVGIAEKYFSEKMILRLKEFFGDIMCTYGIQSKKDFCSFLTENNKIEILRISPENRYYEDRDAQVLATMNEVEYIHDLPHFEDFESFNFDDKKAYVVFLFDRTTYKKTKERLKKTGSSNTIIYPLHKSLHGYDDFIYNLDTRDKINITDIDKYAENLLIIYDETIPIDLNFLLKIMDKQNIKAGITGCIPNSAKEIIRNSSSLKHFDKFTEANSYGYDTVLINSQEAEFAYETARRISQIPAINNIYSFHPLFEYRMPTLEKIIDQIKSLE